MRMFLLIFLQCLLYEHSYSVIVADYISLLAAVREQNYDQAISITKELSQYQDGGSLAITMNLLLQTETEKMLPFAYRLWEAGEKQIVANYFPRAFKLTINQDNIVLINYKHKMGLKLDVNTDDDGDRALWGDGYKVDIHRLIWTLHPIWENNRIYFKIKNLDKNMFIKLNYSPDDIGDRKAWGDSLNVPVNRLKWSLKPQIKNKELVFYIINQEFGQALKLGVRTDEYNDRIVWGHNGGFSDDPDKYLWQIAEM